MQQFRSERVGALVGVAIHEAVLSVGNALFADEAREKEDDPGELVAEGTSVPEVRDGACERPGFSDDAQRLAGGECAQYAEDPFDPRQSEDGFV